eukprot:g2171.t1
MGAGSSFDVPVEADVGKLLVERKVSKLLSDQAALDTVCRSLWASAKDAGGMSREQLRSLTREVVQSAGAKDVEALQELIDMLQPTTNAEAQPVDRLSQAGSASVNGQRWKEGSKATRH